MKLTKGQDAALVKILAWLKSNDEWMFVLKGAAGTGKTTLMQSVIDACGDNKPVCCAPTGKAASVLRSKLKGIDVKTIHQTLYQPSGKNLERLAALEAALSAARADGKPDRKILIEIGQERDRLANERVNFSLKSVTGIYPGKFVIVDEASMTSERMVEDFRKTGCRCLFVGDGFQLPPVNARDWFGEHRPDAELTEITRQAKESPILRLSMQIREKTIDLAQYTKGDCIVTDVDKVDPKEWLLADQVLTGSNASRQKINRFFRRQLYGKDVSKMPIAGEKMICLKNNHHKLPAWINGVQFVTNDECKVMPDGSIGLFADYEGTHLLGVEFYVHNCVSHYGEAKELELDKDMREGMFEGDYAYGITVHKSQGSEWDFVIVGDDRINFNNKAFRQRWLYTAVTRARKKLLFISNKDHGG